MAATQQQQPPVSTATITTKDRPGDHRIDTSAMAGTPNSLGAESVRDGRPSTDDSVVEAMDEGSPEVSATTIHEKR